MILKYKHALGLHEKEFFILRKIILIMAFIALLIPDAYACVGKTLTIGVTDSTESKVLAQMLSILVNERTGTTINIEYFDEVEDIYEAVREQEVDISIENTTRAMQLLKMPAQSDVKKAYKAVKATYEKEKGLIWLKPFGFTKGRGEGPPSYTATILRMDVLNNFPALPRLFNKLGSTINDDTYIKLMESVESGREPEGVVKDFLKSKKLI